MARVAEAQLALAFEDQEHFLLGMMIVEWALRLARRQHGEVVAELARTDARRDLAAPGRVEAIVFDVVELDVVEIHQRFVHGGSHGWHCPGLSAGRRRAGRGR
jgi:hypothetical protein